MKAAVQSTRAMLTELAVARWPEAVDIAGDGSLYQCINGPDRKTITQTSSMGQPGSPVSQADVTAGPVCGERAVAYSTRSGAACHAVGFDPCGSPPSWTSPWTPAPVWADADVLMGLVGEGADARVMGWDPATGREVHGPVLRGVAPRECFLARGVGGQVLIGITRLVGNLLEADLGGSDVRPLIDHEDRGRLIAARLSPSRDRLAIVVNEPGMSSLRVTGPHGGRSSLHTLPRLAGRPVWLDDRSLLLPLDEHPFVGTARYDTARRSLQRITLQNTGFVSQLSGKGGSAYALASGPSCSPRLFRIDPDGAVTANSTVDEGEGNGLRTEYARIPTPRGYSLPCLIYRPRDTEPRATVIMLHGGPSASWRAGWSPWVAALVHARFRVALLETRGSTATRASKPRLPAPQRYGVSETEDVGAAIEWLRRDKNAVVCLYGHSYGAYLAAKAAEAHPDIAAVVMTSGFFGGRDLNESRDPAVLRFIQHAHGLPAVAPRLPCPVLLVNGQLDSQIPVAAVEHTFRALTAPKKQMIVLPGEGHAFTTRTNIIHWFGVGLDFLIEAAGR